MAGCFYKKPALFFCDFPNSGVLSEQLRFLATAINWDSFNHHSGSFYRFTKNRHGKNC